MSSECNECEERATEYNREPFCRLQPNGSDVPINENVLMELVFWARRYCDDRSTYAPTRFNWIYKYLRTLYPDLLRCKDRFDPTLKDKGVYWPFAQDGMYNEKTGSYDAKNEY